MVCLLVSQIFDVTISAQPNVVSQVPADMVGIGVDDDVVAVPEPVIAEADVGRGDAKEEPVKAETLRAAACKAVDMARAEGAWKVSVLPGAIEMVARIILAG